MGIDILGIDIMGVDISGIDIPAPTRWNKLNSYLGCTTFRRKSFRRYDFGSHTTFGRCDFPSSTTFSRKKYPGKTFHRNGQLNYFITNHLRNQFN